MPVYITIALALVPSLLLVRYFQLRDIYPEPSRQIWTTFILGALTVVPILLITLPMLAIFPMPEHPVVRGTALAFLFAAIPEEFFKLAVLAGYSMRRRAFDEPMDGIVYGAVVGQGFAAFENAMYSVSGGVGIAVARAFTAVPAHACMGVIMGHYIGLARFDAKNRTRLIAKGFFFAVLVHGLYDAPLLTLQSLVAQTGELAAEDESFSGLLVTGAFLVLAISIRWAHRLAKAARRAQRELRVPPPIPEQAVSMLRSPERAIGTATLWWGALLAVAGGVITAGGIRILLLADAAPRTLAFMIAAVVVAGVVPLVSGLTLFTNGVRRLNRAASAQAPIT
ncbi:MAG: PrsW family glutamic-type intramembrane protease [Candidatus Hydrogenedentes bacterium]|nr:PrsW family glutamic-type intramembrane protease [Candidatus Hydrogenedentota bacterium]